MRCTKCNGLIYDGQDIWGTYSFCRQCGSEINKPEVLSTKSVRLPTLEYESKYREGTFLGEIVWGRAIGKSVRTRYIWQICPACKKERWSDIRSIGKECGKCNSNGRFSKITKRKIASSIEGDK